MKIKIQQFDCPSYHRDDLKSSFNFIIPLIIELAFMFTLVINVGNIVTERHSKMKELLQISGIKWYAYWLSNMARSFFVYTLLSILIVIIGNVELSPRTNLDPNYTNKSIFEFTHFTVILLTCLVYSFQTTMFTLLVAQMFNKGL